MIEILIGNIVDEVTDAIVNAANEMLLPGSDISDAIHSAAGRNLDMKVCRLVGTQRARRVLQSATISRQNM